MSDAAAARAADAAGAAAPSHDPTEAAAETQLEKDNGAADAAAAPTTAASDSGVDSAPSETSGPSDPAMAALSSSLSGLAIEPGSSGGNRKKQQITQCEIF